MPMARMAIYPFGRVGSLANVYRFPRSGVADDLANSRLFEQAAGVNTGTIAFTLDGVSVAIDAIFLHTGTVAVTLDPISVTIDATQIHNGTLTANLDGVTVAIDGAVDHNSKTGTLEVALDDIGFDAVATATSSTPALHGRKPRGKRVIYKDEIDLLPVIPVETVKIEPLPSLERAKVVLAEAKQALESVLRAKEAAIQAKQRARPSTRWKWL